MQIQGFSGQLNYVDCCPNEPEPGNAFCEEHTREAQGNGANRIHSILCHKYGATYVKRCRKYQTSLINIMIYVIVISSLGVTVNQIHPDWA